MFLTCVVLFSLCRTSFGVKHGPSHIRVSVKEGSDVVLPCSPGNQDLNSALFDWNKVEPNDQNPKEVFLYDAGEHYNNGRVGQDQQFKGRVSHFGDELQHGNASIKIHNTKVEDRGIYTCYFPHLHPPQIFHVELVVDWILKDRSGSPGVAPAPDIRTVKATDDWWLLQCDVRGASPEPTVKWKNSDGKVLNAQEPQVTESEGRYNITLLITVDQTGLYRCVVTQEELHHQIHSETFIYISGGKKCASENPGWGWLILAFVFGGVITFAALWIWPVLRKLCRCGGSADSEAVSKVDEEAVPLSTKATSVIRVSVKEGSDAEMLCFLWNQNLTGKVFIWKKEEQKVFSYAEDNIDNGGPSGQGQQFKGRVSHFRSQLQHGNASIKIHNTKVEDSGIYTCHFPGLDPPQIFYVELVVVGSNGRLLNSSTFQ